MNNVFFRFTISVRDILTWVGFLNSCTEMVDITEAYVHGACLTFLDSLGSGVTGNERYYYIIYFNDTFEKKNDTNSFATLFVVFFSKVTVLDYQMM